MDEPSAELCTRHVVQVVDGSQSLSELSTSLVARQVSHSNDTYYLPTNLEEHLLHMTRRIASLHFRSRQEGGASATAITEAVQIWNDLDNWASPETLPSTDFDDFFQLYTFYLYVWLHLIIYPNSAGSDKVQGMVTRGLIILEEFDGSFEAPALLLVPTLIYGVASVQNKDMEAVYRHFIKMEGNVDHNLLRTYKKIVMWAWGRHNNDIKWSWDWMDYLDTVSD